MKEDKTRRGYLAFCGIIQRSTTTDFINEIFIRIFADKVAVSSRNQNGFVRRTLVITNYFLHHVENQHLPESKVTPQRCLPRKPRSFSEHSQG